MRIHLRGHGNVDMQLAPATSSWLLRLAPWTRGAWVTLAQTVYYPAHVTDPSRHLSTLAHEYVHVLQWRRWHLLLWIGYVFGVPLPFGAALIRARVECTAYAHEVVHYGRALEDCVDAICSALYGWPAPKWLVRRWLRRAISRVAAIRE